MKQPTPQMKLRHYSWRIVTEVHGEHQTNGNSLNPKKLGHSLSSKPNGFWVSDETRGAYGWRSWCRDERFRSFAMRYEHEVILSPNAKILYLRSPEDIDRFTKRYGYDNLSRLTYKDGTPLLPNRTWQRFDAIDWHRVAKRYHGIIITPYQWSRRLDGGANWYYTWDCASGCIWNRRAIQSIEMIRERKVPPKPTYWQRRRAHKRQMARMAKLTMELSEQLKTRRAAKEVDNVGTTD